MLDLVSDPFYQDAVEQARKATDRVLALSVAYGRVKTTQPLDADAVEVARVNWLSQIRLASVLRQRRMETGAALHLLYYAEPALYQVEGKMEGPSPDALSLYRQYLIENLTKT